MMVLWYSDIVALWDCMVYWYYDIIPATSGKRGGGVGAACGYMFIFYIFSAILIQAIFKSTILTSQVLLCMKGSSKLSPDDQNTLFQ